MRIVSRVVVSSVCAMWLAACGGPETVVGPTAQEEGGVRSAQSGPAPVPFRLLMSREIVAVTAISLANARRYVPAEYDIPLDADGNATLVVLYDVVPSSEFYGDSAGRADYAQGLVAVNPPADVTADPTDQWYYSVFLDTQNWKWLKATRDFGWGSSVTRPSAFSFSFSSSGNNSAKVWYPNGGRHSAYESIVTAPHEPTGARVHFLYNGSLGRTDMEENCNYFASPNMGTLTLKASPGTRLYNLIGGSETTGITFSTSKGDCVSSLHRL